jgi:hypothetical protein
VKVTEPPAEDGVTVAVKITASPYVEGFNEDARLTDVDVFPKPCATNARQTIAKIRIRDLVCVMAPL